MSAFVVSHDHIDALLTFAQNKRIVDQLAYCINHGSEKLTLTSIGRVLLAENERSVCHRYSDVTPGNAPGTIGEEAVNYTFKHFHEFAHMRHEKMLAWVLHGCSCYDYQSCETDDYEQSIAHRIIRKIEAKAIRCLPHMEDAPWEINRAKAAA